MSRLWFILGLVLGAVPRLRYWRRGFVVRRVALVLRGPSLAATPASQGLYAGADWQTPKTQVSRR